MDRELSKKQLKEFISSFTMQTYTKIIKFSGQIHLGKNARKTDYTNALVDFLGDPNKIKSFVNKLNTTDKSAKLYSHLIWLDEKIDVAVANDLYKLGLPEVKLPQYSHYTQEMLEDEYCLIERKTIDYWNGRNDTLKIDSDVRQILRLFYPKPDDYYMKDVSNIKETKYHYSNENEVLQFINTIENMLQSNLVEFGKTNEKPLLKTLNLLKSSSNIKEFFADKKHNNIAIDMLTRGFSFYYWDKNKFAKKEQDSLKRFLDAQLNNSLSYFVSKFFVSHLKRVRFDSVYSSEKELLEIMKSILKHLVNHSWVSVKNIIHFCQYREFYFHFESSYKTNEYYMIDDKGNEVSARKYYIEIFYEPILKAALFYLGALGILELKYDDPKNNHKIKIPNLEYISIWDGLKYVKITNLGLFVLGAIRTYQAKEIKKTQGGIKFDEYKPIITVDKNDTITRAKLESYCDIYDSNRYILSYQKIFKDCNTLKALNLKIDGFYKIFDTKAPKIFDEFFEEIRQNANALKRNLKLITIELKNNKKLLNLFMNNKKLQEITIKASGYRVLVKKDDIAKLTKIVKDNGFFIEF